MSTYGGERSIDGENTFTLGSIDAPEPLVVAVEQWAKRHSVTRARAIRLLLAQSLDVEIRAHDRRTNDRAV